MQHPDDAARTTEDLFDWLSDLARARAICPTTLRLAGRLGISPTEARLAFERLRAEGLIDWTVVHCGPIHGRVRRVTILATGQSTSTPEDCGWKRPLFDTELEAAKSVLRRKGRIVFDAEVIDGLRGRGLTKVDHRRLDRSAVIAMAASVTF